MCYLWSPFCESQLVSVACMPPSCLSPPQRAADLPQILSESELLTPCCSGKTQETNLAEENTFIEACPWGKRATLVFHISCLRGERVKSYAKTPGVTRRQWPGAPVMSRVSLCACFPFSFEGDPDLILRVPGGRRLGFFLSKCYFQASQFIWAVGGSDPVLRVWNIGWRDGC